MSSRTGNQFRMDSPTAARPDAAPSHLPWRRILRVGAGVGLIVVIAVFYLQAKHTLSDVPTDFSPSAPQIIQVWTEAAVRMIAATAMAMGVYIATKMGD